MIRNGNVSCLRAGLVSRSLQLHLTCSFPFPSVSACLLSLPAHQEQKRIDGTTREVKKVRKARNRRQEWSMMAYDKELRPDNRLSQSVYHGASSEGSLSPDTRCVCVCCRKPLCSKLVLLYVGNAPVSLVFIWPMICCKNFP